MDITTYSYGSVHLQQIGFALQNFRPQVYNPQRLFLGQSAFAIKVLLEKLEIRFVAIIWREKLFFGW